MRRTTKLSILLALVTMLLVPTWGVSPASAQTSDGRVPVMPEASGATRTKVQYGPYTVQGAPTNPDGTHGHVHTGNQFAFGIEKPCTNCYITGMQADLRYADGSQGGYSTDVQLHHMVLANQAWGRTDATCYIGFPFPLGLMFGQRFFASGDERTPIDLPDGYGYQVGGFDNWNLIYELANTSTSSQSVYIEMTFDWVPASTGGMSNVEPIWFDAAQCGFSTFSVPAGQSQRSWTWNVNRPGDVVSIGGHVHDGGINLETRNDTTGEVICDSVAGYGESDLYMDHHGGGHISSMSTCDEDPVASVSSGERVTIRANYDMDEAVDDQMAIAIGYIAQ